MPQYKLHYFDTPTRGRAEFARLILVQAGVQFEDIRFKHSEWPTIKPTTPFGSVPVLEVDGKQLAQSITIARYLARQHGLAGQNEWEQSLADMYADNINDLMNAVVPAFQEKDQVKQTEMYGKILNEVIVPHANKVEGHLKKNNTGFLVGDKLTWADLVYYAYYNFVIELFGQDVLKDAPLLIDLIERVAALPNIKKWAETRPKSSR